MKYIPYIIIFFSLFACQIDESYDIPDGKEDIVIEFETNISAVRTKAGFSDNDITQLSVLLFDEKGLFIKLATAEIQSFSGTNGTFRIKLPSSSSSRILHFIAEHDWSTFNEELSVGKDEQEIIPSLWNDQSLIFWDRKELNGIYEGCLTGNTIELVRNMAKITIDNQEEQGRLTDAWFAVYNKPDKGTLAPFHTQTGKFLTQYNGSPVITVPAETSFTEYDRQFLPTDGLSTSFVYERSNTGTTGQTNTDALFIIIRGKFDGSAADNFYKIELYDKQTLKLYDIQRNYYFRVTITEVGYSGYATLDEALQSPASNHLTASVVLEEYPTITNKDYSLTVEKTSALFTNNEEQMEVAVTYRKLSDGSVDNSKIEVYDVYEQNSSYPVFKSHPQYNALTGKLTAELHPIVSGTSRTATITVKADNLIRKVKVTIADPFEFSSLSISPQYVSSTVGSDVNISFTIPGMAEEFLPVICRITANGLSSNSSKMEVNYTGNSWEYLYTIDRTGLHTLNFLTNSPTSAESVRLESDIFKTAYINYSNQANPGIYNFNDVKITPEKVPFLADNEVLLEFTMAKNNLVVIETEKFKPAPGQNGITHNQNFIAYVPSESGKQAIRLLTTQDNNNETIRIHSNDHISKSLKIENQLVRLKGNFTLNNGPIRHPEEIDNPYGCRMWAVCGLNMIDHSVDRIAGSFYASAENATWGDYDTLLEAYYGERVSICFTLFQFYHNPLVEGVTYWVADYVDIYVSGHDMTLNYDFKYN